jgi:hypothetical protein
MTGQKEFKDNQGIDQQRSMNMRLCFQNLRNQSTETNDDQGYRSIINGIGNTAAVVKTETKESRMQKLMDIIDEALSICNEVQNITNDTVGRYNSEETRTGGIGQ